MTDAVKVPDQIVSGGVTYAATGAPAHPYVALPETFTDAQWDEVRRMNPGVTLLRVVPSPGATGPVAGVATAIVTDVSHDAISAWTDIIGGLLGAGASILVPGPWLPVVQTILHAGVDAVRTLLGGTYRERWTLQQILLEAATPSAVPAT